MFKTKQDLGPPTHRVVVYDNVAGGSKSTPLWAEQGGTTSQQLVDLFKAAGDLLDAARNAIEVLDDRDDDGAREAARMLIDAVDQATAAQAPSAGVT